MEDGARGQDSHRVTDQPQNVRSHKRFNATVLVAAISQNDGSENRAREEKRFSQHDSFLVFADQLVLKVLYSGTGAIY